MKDTMKEFFEKSKEEYSKFLKENERPPTEKEWNKIAKDKKLLSNLSMRYMGNMRFSKKIF